MWLFSVYCGICHTDVHFSDGSMTTGPWATKWPIVPGHELAGLATKVRPNILLQRTWPRASRPGHQGEANIVLQRNWPWVGRPGYQGEANILLIVPGHELAGLATKVRPDILLQRTWPWAGWPGYQGYPTFSYILLQCTWPWTGFPGQQGEANIILQRTWP